ncbi:unnamed protein product [Merluccius merluccius]
MISSRELPSVQKESSGWFQLQVTHSSFPCTPVGAMSPPGPQPADLQPGMPSRLMGSYQSAEMDGLVWAAKMGAIPSAVDGGVWPREGKTAIRPGTVAVRNWVAWVGGVAQVTVDVCPGQVHGPSDLGPTGGHDPRTRSGEDRLQAAKGGASPWEASWDAMVRAACWDGGGACCGLPSSTLTCLQ